MTPLANVTLRAACPLDAPLYYSAVRRTMYEAVIATWGEWNDQRVRQQAVEFGASPDGQVIEVGKEAAGVLWVERKPSFHWLGQIYLLPEFQRQGIGTRLLKALVAEASATGVPIRLRVLRLNPAKRG